MNIPIKAIVKYIEQVYKPDDVDVKLVEKEEESPDIYISLFFKRASDEYIKNPYAIDVIGHKEAHMELAIRKDVESFFSVKTTGLDTRGFAPYVHHKLTINVTISRTGK